MTCTYLAKRLRELFSTKTGSYPHEFLCRTNCSACADYQPWTQKTKKMRTVMVFCFVQKFFSDNTRVRIFIVFVANLTLGYMTTLWIRLFFFSSTKIRFFFSNIGNQNIFLEKNHNPSPFKLYGRSLKRIFLKININYYLFYLISNKTMFMRSLVFCVMFCRLLFVLLYYFLLAIVLSHLLRFTNYGYPFVILKLFL